METANQPPIQAPRDASGDVIYGSDRDWRQRGGDCLHPKHMLVRTVMGKRNRVTCKQCGKFIGYED